MIKVLRKMTDMVNICVRENWDAPFIASFMFLLTVAVTLSIDSIALVDVASNITCCALAVGIVLQLFRCLLDLNGDPLC